MQLVVAILFTISAGTFWISAASMGGLWWVSAPLMTVAAILSWVTYGIQQSGGS